MKGSTISAGATALQITVIFRTFLSLPRQSHSFRSSQLTIPHSSLSNSTMADREKDFSHNGSFNPNYPTAHHGGDDATHTGTLNPNYPTGGNSTTYHMGNDVSSDTALRRIKTAGSISISPELFEKIYLSPQNAVKGDLRKTFGNPTPLCVVQISTAKSSWLTEWVELSLASYSVSVHFPAI